MLGPELGAEHPQFPSWYVIKPDVLTRIEFRGDVRWYGCYAYLHDEDIQRSLFFRTWEMTGWSLISHPELAAEITIEIGDAEWILSYRYDTHRMMFVNES